MSTPALDRYVRHAELFGTECVYETAAQMWPAWAALVREELDAVHEAHPAPVDLTRAVPADHDRRLDEYQRRFKTYKKRVGEAELRLAKCKHMRGLGQPVRVDRAEAMLLRLRVELDMVDARGPRWRRNGRKPTSAGEVKQAVATLAADGLAVAAIASEVGIDVDRVQRLIDSHRTNGRRRRRSADETKAMVAALWREQPNTTWIAGRLGITAKRVQQLLLDQGLLGSRPPRLTPSNAGGFRPRTAEVDAEPIPGQIELFAGEAIDRACGLDDREENQR
jgi:hypothetical protein